MPKISAGLLMYRIQNGRVEVLLVHPGGPFFKNKDAGAWTIPKGEPNPNEELLQAAQREFTEETGLQPCPPFTMLTPIKQKGGKVVHAWAFAGECDPQSIRSNFFTIEWPPKSKKQVQFPEIDRADWFDLEQGRDRIIAEQSPLLIELGGALERTENTPS